VQLGSWPLFHADLLIVAICGQGEGLKNLDAQCTWSQHMTGQEYVHYDNKARMHNPCHPKKYRKLCVRMDVRKSAQALDREDSPLAIFVPCIAQPTGNPRREKETK
jgi:hypothetical protein